MIKDRPTHLLNQADYKKLPAKPFGITVDALAPHLIAKSSWREATGLNRAIPTHASA
jgi:hypothetical protein